MSEKDLGRAIIKQALRDATIPQDIDIRVQARLFLLGSTKSWLESLQLVCELADLNPYTIRKKCQEWELKGWPTAKYINRFIEEK